MTCLHYASEGGHEAIVQFLLDKGALVNAKEEISTNTECSFCIYVYDYIDGDTSLHVACQYQHQSIVEILLSFGADVTIMNNGISYPY